MPIKIKSTSGSVTLDAQNVSGDQTLTVPSQSGATLQTTADTITSSRLSGALPALDGSSLTGVADATKLPLSGGTLTNTLTVQNNVSSNTDPSLVLSGTSNLSQDCYLQMAECWTGLPLAMGMDNSTNTFKIARNSSGNLNSGTQLEITSDGRGLSQFTAKAWINFNGAGTVSIRDSHGVSTLADSGTGYYVISFSNDFGNANYSFQYCGGSSGGAETTFQLASTPGSGSNRVQLKNAAGTATDRDYITGLYFGD